MCFFHVSDSLCQEIFPSKHLRAEDVPLSVLGFPRYEAVGVVGGGWKLSTWIGVENGGNVCPPLGSCESIGYQGTPTPPPGNKALVFKG